MVYKKVLRQVPFPGDMKFATPIIPLLICKLLEIMKKMSNPTHTQLGISKSKSFELKLHKTAAKFRENAVVFVRKDLNSRKVFEMMRHKDSDHAHMA